MIHPNTKIQVASETSGYNVYATRLIPKGTMVYAQDKLDTIISPEDFKKCSFALQKEINKFAFIDEKGNHIVCRDFAKYTSHSCSPNTMSTGYGFEIAIRDIYPGEEITDEYGMLNLSEDFFCECNQSNCRGTITRFDIDKYYNIWDEKIKMALLTFKRVHQPLLPMLGPKTEKQVQAYLSDPKNYRSVVHLKHTPPSIQLLN